MILRCGIFSNTHFCFRQRRYFSEEYGCFSQKRPVPASSILSLIPFLDQKGIISLPYDERHPIILRMLTHVAPGTMYAYYYITWW